MILNNSGIVHCATRTRGREETAMNMQELLTYVEELTFKTSMFGYDKDEVDIQLDKICDGNLYDRCAVGLYYVSAVFYI